MTCKWMKRSDILKISHSFIQQSLLHRKQTRKFLLFKLLSNRFFSKLAEYRIIRRFTLYLGFIGKTEEDWKLWNRSFNWKNWLTDDWKQNLSWAASLNESAAKHISPNLSLSFHHSVNSLQNRNFFCISGLNWHLTRHKKKIQSNERTGFVEDVDK